MTWQANGYEIGGNCGELIGSLAGLPVLVVGSAETFLEEYAQMRQALPHAVVFAVNDAIPYLPVVHYAISLHADKLVHWSGLRTYDAHVTPWKTMSRTTEDGKIDYLWQIQPQFGLSGYFAMQIALIMGAGLIVLCGCPGDRTRRFFDRASRTDTDYQTHGVREQLLAEVKRVSELRAKVRSCSGWTKEVFGSYEAMESDSSTEHSRATASA